MRAKVTFAGLLILAASTAWLSKAQQTSQTRTSMSDRDKAELRGPVKTVIEEQSFSNPDGNKWHTTTTTTYSPDGRILEERTRNSDGSEWVRSNTYYSDGRLLKRDWGNGNSTPKSEMTYLYDDEKRLMGLKSGDKVQVHYQYDDKGHKSAVETYESEPLRPNTAFAPHWEDTDLGFTTYLGGTVTTMYNDQGIATGAEFRDPEGKLLGHIVRKFDEEGRIVSEEQFPDAPRELPLPALPEEIRSQLNPEQINALSAAAGALATGMEKRTNSYSYDEHGHVTERHRSGGVFDDEVTITKYNDRGDKASERTTTVMNPIAGRQFSIGPAGAMIPQGPPPPVQPPMVSETQYTYQYDSFGNWTELTTASRSGTDTTLGPATVRHRKLTYY